MKLTTICFCLKGDQILLAMKKRGFGTGKWNGYGGKIDGDESVRASAIRELKEESSLVTDEKDLTQVAIINFYFAGAQMFECHVFTTHAWNGEAVETDEMRPQWYKLDEIPYSEMWADDKHWLPLVLNGEKIKADCYFNSDGSVVEKFSWDEAEFD